MAMDGSPGTVETNDDASAQKLIDLLEFEIKRIEEKQKRPGWTAWALVGAIAALLWAALSVIETAKRIDTASIGFLVLVLVAASDLVKTMHRIIGYSGGSNVVARFRWSREEYGQSRTSLVCNTLRFFIILLLAWKVLDGRHPWTERALLLFYSVVILAGFTSVIMSFFSSAVPSSDSVPEYPARIVGSILILLLMLGLMGLFEHLSSGHVAPTIAEWKIAGIIAALAIALQLLWSGGREMPLMQTFIDLRRQLATSEITYSAARRHFDIALRGLGATEVLQRRVEAVLTSLRSAVGPLSDAVVQLGALKNQFERNPEISLIEKKALSEPLFKSVEERLNATEEGISAASAKISRLHGHARALSWLYPASRSDVDNILSQTRAAVSDAQAAIKIHLSAIKEILNWLTQNEIEVPASLLTFEVPGSSKPTRA